MGDNFTGKGLVLSVSLSTGRHYFGATGLAVFPAPLFETVLIIH